MHEDVEADERALRKKEHLLDQEQARLLPLFASCASAASRTSRRATVQMQFRSPGDGVITSFLPL